MNALSTFPKMPEMTVEVSESVRDSDDDESQGQEDHQIIDLISQVLIGYITFPSIYLSLYTIILFLL